MQQKTKNTIIFVVVMAVVVAGWYLLQLWFPPPKPAPTPPDDAAKAEPIPREGISRIALGLAAVNPVPQGESLWLALQGIEQAAKAKPGPKVDEHPAPPPVVRREPTPDDKILHLGATTRDPKFHLGVDLNPRGAGVEKVTLNKFQAATDQGRPAYLDEKQTQPKPMELVPQDREHPSNLLYHYEVSDSNRDKPDDKPLDTLGIVDWTGPGGMAPGVTESQQDGRLVQEATFVSPEVDGVQISKTYTLTEGDYHLGLRVEIERKRAGDKPMKFRYQLVGAHGLPVEGKWYTGIFRNSLIGMVDKDKNALREFQDLRQLSLWEGGNEIRPQENNYFIRYAGVAVQYFASVVVVDDHQEGQQDQQGKDIIERVRPTLEKGVTKGVVTKVERDRFSVKRADGSEQVFFYDEKDPDRIRDLVHEEMHVAVIHTTGSYSEKLGAYPLFAHDIRDEAKTQPVWEDDVTVRLMTAPIDLKQAGDKVVHKYLLYNGPVKVMLLGQESGDAAVPAGVVSHYENDLRLNTLTDYQSATWIGTVASTLKITYLLIYTTNIMHMVLGWLHMVIPNYILCIICLTVLVRGMMFPLSRKQALTSVRMQELAPELKELQKKYKDDKQGMAAAQMELYRKHGVNPFGTCWVLFLQMPIFMGLYYALQESIHFRLEGLAWWWIPNLAAPDMLIPWSESIPFISSPEYYGWFFYLGPYFNLLPVVAVSLMMIQQKLTMPPPTDEQQEMQQKMMKYMMVFMAIMFYKVAAGLCVYFIASNLWGFAERRLLPRRKKGADPKPPESYFQKLFGRRAATAENGAAPAASPPAAATGITTGKTDPASAQFSPEPRGKKKRGRKQRRQDRARGEDTSRPKNEAAAATATAPSLLQRLRDWWDGVLEQARKK